MKIAYEQIDFSRPSLEIIDQANDVRKAFRGIGVNIFYTS